MNIFLASTLFAVVILVYWFILELFAMLFRATGLPAIYLEASEPPLCGHSSPGASVFFQHGDLQVVERD